MSLVPRDASALPAAELERRLYAFTIDRLIAWSLVGLGAVVAHHLLVAQGAVAAGVAAVVGSVLLVGVGFSAFQGLRGTTPGKALLGLRLVHPRSGTPIGIVAAMIRSLILGLSTLPTFGLGLATLAWTAARDRDRRRRGWHDHLTESVVVDVRPAPAEAVEVERGAGQVVNLTALRLVPAPPPLPASAPAATGPAPSVSASPSAAAGRWRVAFDTGESVVVEGLALVGRRPEPRADEPVRHLLRLPSQDMSLSKTHAQLQVAPDGALVVMDRRSTNGSVVLRQGLARDLPAGKPTTLLPDDVVRFGDRTMTVSRES